MLTFNKRPISISPEYRPMYRVAQIVMILKVASTKNTASLLKLHFFSWAMRSKKNMEEALQLVSTNPSTYNFPKLWSVEPSLNRALTYVVAEGLVNIEKGKYHLNNKGELLFKSIEKDDNLFMDEKQFLNTVKKKISDSRLQRLAKWWEHNYA